MSSPPNETSDISLRNGTDPVLRSARALAEFLVQHRSFLNVERENTAIFILILLIKNAIVCYGIASLVSVQLTIKLLVALSCFSLVLLAGSYVLNLTIVWGSFAAVLCFSSGVIPLPTVPRFLISVMALCVAPIYFHVPCTLESIIDIFLIIHVSVFLLKAFLGPVERIIEYSFVELTIILILLAVDLAFDAQGFYFTMLLILTVFFPIVVNPFIRGEFLYSIVMSILFVYCFHEQILMHHYRLANIT